MSILGISRVAFRVTGSKFISFQPDGTMAIRDNPNTPGFPGAYETIEVLLLGEEAPFSDIIPPVDPSTKGVVMPGNASDPPRERFMALVEGRPFSQQTLLDVEPILKNSGWLLTPPNLVGDRSKIHPPGGPWVRVGFGEGAWVWVAQGDQ